MKPTLFCKPLAGARESQILFEKNFYENVNISFRSYNPESDLNTIYEWVNKEYSRQFWQLHGSKALIENTYFGIMSNSSSHSFIGLLNKKPICQIDIYLIVVDEIGDHILAELNDAGMHFHMAPITQPVKGLSAFAMSAFLEYYFSFPQAKRMYGEPDVGNAKANMLVKRVGFEFLKEVQMSYKAANLYRLTRDQFQIMRTSRNNN